MAATLHHKKEASLKDRLEPPRKYQVCLLNDDYTPMDFVVDILMHIFYMPAEQAHAVMRLVHETGKGLCGVYNRDIALTKQQHVIHKAEASGHPLQCTVEELS